MQQKILTIAEAFVLLNAWDVVRGSKASVGIWISATFASSVCWVIVARIDATFYWMYEIYE